MSESVDQLITDILNREGPTYTNKPSDRGGPTKYGITLATLTAWRKRKTTSKDVENLTEPEAREIYRVNYIEKTGYGKFSDNPGLIEQLIDAGVNHGVGNAIRILQRSLKVADDGSIGPVTLAAYAKKDKADVVILFMAHRAKFYGSILDPRKNKDARTQWEYAAGWFNRFGDVIAEYADSN